MFGWSKKTDRKPAGPDFSKVDTLAKAEALYQRGELQKLLLMPLEPGGQNVPLNHGHQDLGRGIDSRVARPTPSPTRWISGPDDGRPGLCHRRSGPVLGPAFKPAFTGLLRADPLRR